MEKPLPSKKKRVIPQEDAYGKDPATKRNPTTGREIIHGNIKSETAQKQLAARNAREKTQPEKVRQSAYKSEAGKPKNMYGAQGEKVDQGARNYNEKTKATSDKIDGYLGYNNPEYEKSKNQAVVPIKRNGASKISKGYNRMP